MLILSRKLGEQIRINDNVTLTVKEIRKGRVVLGIEAPQTVSVYRQEIWEHFHGNEAEKETR